MKRFVAVLVLVVPGVAEAYECTRSDIDDATPIAWPIREVRYSVDGNANLDFSAVDASFSTWSDVSCADLELRFDGVGFDTGRGIFVTVASVDIMIDPATAALTNTFYHQKTGTILSSRIELDGVNKTFGDTATNMCTQTEETYDLVSVLTHEVGHAIGLAHTVMYDGSPSDPTMAPRLVACDTTKRDLAQDDIDAICALYPRDGAGACRGQPVMATTDLEESGCTATGAHGGSRPLWLVAIAFAALCRKRR